MSIVIVLILVLVVGGLIAKFYPAPKSKPEFTIDSISEPVVETEIVVEEPVVDVPKMDAKPKKTATKKPAKKVKEQA